MLKTSSILFLVSAVFGAEVQDFSRDCPSGFSYFGEVPVPENARDFWTQGDRTPTYSCYKIHTGPFSDWTNASQRCFEDEAQLMSVNNYHEEDVLMGEEAMKALEAADITSLLTSGISLSPGEWTWFGAGEKVGNITVETSANTTEMAGTTMCIQISWAVGMEENRHGDDNDHGHHDDDDHSSTPASLAVPPVLSYTAVPCVAPAPAMMCEVRVYTQTWYYWATTNWLSILFLFTLILLIVSACVTVQMYTSRPSPRMMARQQAQAEQGNSPPPYTPQATLYPTKPGAQPQSTAGKYAEKGKEMLAKIVFIK